MSPRWLWLAVPPLAVASVLAVERLRGPAPDPGPRLPAAVRQVKTSDETPKTLAEALARAEIGVVAAKARVSARPGDWVFYEGLSRSYSTRARLTGSFDDYAAAQAALDRAFALAPAGAGPHLTQAALHFTLHRLDAAERGLDAIDRYAVPPDPLERAEALALRGDIAFYRGDLKAAEAFYRRADALEPGAGTAFRWAVYFTKTGRPETAERFFDAAVAASPSPTPQFRANVELQKGVLYLERGRWDRALTFFRRADALFPGYYVIEEHIAETLALKGQAAEAEALYAGIVQRTGNPEFMDALAALAQARGDRVAVAAWRSRAAAEWERRLALLPEAAYGHALDHYLSAGDPARALDIARRNHAARPYGDAKVQLAEALLRNGQAGAARRTIEPVLKTDWSTAQLHGVAAQVYGAVGDRRRSAQERARALAINPHELDDARAQAFN